MRCIFGIEGWPMIFLCVYQLASINSLTSLGAMNSSPSGLLAFSMQYLSEWVLAQESASALPVDEFVDVFLLDFF